jgi:nucleoside-diphosphate-sugar epimerase
MSKRLLITGASGFIGRKVVSALSKQGIGVRAAARDPDAIIALSDVERVAMPDLVKPADWSALLDGVTHVVHIAGIAHAPGILPEDVYHRINANSVGELAEQAHGKVERVVFMSSVRAQAGLSAEHALTEKDTPEPTDAYGRAKLEAEQLLAASGVGYTVLRPAVVYGKNVKGNIASLATIAKTPMPLPFGGLANRRSLLALDNLVTAISHVLNTDAAANETFLVADAEPINVGDLVAAMREGLGRPPHLVKVPEGAVRKLLKSFGREADWERVSGEFVIDISKLMATGWRPHIQTHEGIVKMMRAENGAAPSGS